MLGVAVSCLQSDQQQQPSQAQKVLPANCWEWWGFGGNIQCLFTERVKEKVFFVSSLKNGPIFFPRGNATSLIFSPSICFTYIWSSCNLFLSTVQYLKMNWILEVFLFIFYFPGNCTNPLSISLFSRGWVICYPDPVGQISKNLTQNEQLSLFLWVMGREF